MPEKTELLRWFEELVRTRYGTMKDLAKVAHRGAGALTRSATQTGSAGLEPLLRLAADLGESPSKVLAIAKKEDMDALIRTLYGQPSVTLRADIQAVVDFLLLEDDAISKLQALTIEAAKRELQRSQASTPGHGDGYRQAKTDRRAKHGTRQPSGSRDGRA